MLVIGQLLWQYRKIASYILIFTILAGFVVHYRYLIANNKTLAEKLYIAENKIIEQKKDIVENEKIHNETVDEISSLNSILDDDLARLRKTKSKCIKISYPTKSNNDTTTGAKLSERNGIDSRRLFEYAGRCEQVRINLIGTQAFIRKTQQKFND